MKYILFLALLSPTTASVETHSFINDCLDIFIRLDTATKRYESIVRSEKDRQLLNKEIKQYVDELVMYSMNRLSKHTKSEDQLIQDVSTDLTNVLSNLVRINYQYLNFVTNKETTNKELKKKGLETLNKLAEESNKIIDISTGICMTTVEKNKKMDSQKQFLRLTLKQRDNLNTKMQKAFTGLENQNRAESTHFEKSTAIIYHFINLESEFSNN